MYLFLEDMFQHGHQWIANYTSEFGLLPEFLNDPMFKEKTHNASQDQLYTG